MFEQFNYDLIKAGWKYSKVMKQSVEDYVNERSTMFAAKFYKNPCEGGDFRRMRLAANTQALINLDRKQVKLAGDFQDEIKAIRTEYCIRLERQRKENTKSAWFSGQSGEKSFY